MRARRFSRRPILGLLAAGAGASILGAFGCTSRRITEHAPAGDTTGLQLREAARAVQSRSLSPVDLTRACLERIERLAPRLNAFITVTPEQALAEARRAEKEVADGRWRGPLHGIPIALKDNIDTAGIRTTAGSAIFAERVPTADAEVVSRLKAAGAVFLGKLNMHEFGVGATSAISHSGPVHNPWDLDRIAGGSSGGAAAAVAAGLCFGALGTDTGGSIRIPAACCGIVGLKPTYGMVSTLGTIPMSPSFDCIGPMCRTVVDTALLLGAITDDPVVRNYDSDAPRSSSRLRVGVLPTSSIYCDVPADSEVEAAFNEAIDVIRTLVADVRESAIPVPDLGNLVDAEVYSFHAPHLEATPELYDPRTRRAVLAGQGIPPAASARLRQELERHRASIHRTFERADLIVMPTLPEPAMAIRDAGEPFAQSACTFAFSLAGLPVISLPCGFSRSGLPIGLQISGPPLSEPRILALAQAYEHATDWHRRRPPT